MAKGRLEKKDNNKVRKKSKSRPKNLKCFQCHKEGHFKKDCPERKNKLRYARKKTGHAIVAPESTEFGAYDSTRVLIVTDDQR